MTERPVDTSDIEIAEIRGDLKMLIERTENLCDRVDDLGKMVRGSLARQGEHREATLEELRELERRCHESDSKIDRRVRTLERRPIQVSGGAFTPKRLKLILAAIAALAGALGLGGGAAGRLLAEQNPPAKEAKP